MLDKLASVKRHCHMAAKRAYENPSARKNASWKIMGVMTHMAMASVRGDVVAAGIAQQLGVALFPVTEAQQFKDVCEMLRPANSPVELTDKTLYGEQAGCKQPCSPSSICLVAAVFYMLR